MNCRCLGYGYLWRSIAIATVCCGASWTDAGQSEPRAGHSTGVPIASDTCLPVPLRTQTPPGNSGLFIGVNRFDDESLPPLRFAVHDAIEQAYLFVVELKLIRPGKCVIALCGEPSAQSIDQHLTTLRTLGVTVIGADRTSILVALKNNVAAPGQPADLLIVSIGSHGFDKDGIAYIMPSDGRVNLLERTGLSLKDLELQMAEAKSISHRLLIVDACQKRILSDGRRGVMETQVVGMSTAFEAALKETTGQGKFASCSRGEASYESYALGNVGHGVFTCAILEALRGAARPDADNLMRLDSVISYVNQRVTQWTDQQNRVLNLGPETLKQSPSWHGPETMRQMPLAQSGDEIEALIAQLRKQVDGDQFSEPQCEQLVTWLKSNTLPSSHSREFLQDIRRFAAREIPARMFVPYITLKLTGQPVRLQGPFSAQDAEAARDAWVASQHRHSTVENSLGMRFALIPAGEFLMGSDLGDLGRDEDEYRHPVRLTEPYYLAMCETTQAQYQTVMGMNPSYFSPEGAGHHKVGDADTATFPTENVTWHDAVEFCRRLAALPEERDSGRTYRLPTEAEWEFACLANGNDGNGSNGNSNGSDHGTSARLTLADQAWYKANASGCVRPVGLLAANGFGLHDMLGNVSEWCQDWYDPTYYPASPIVDPLGPQDSSDKVKVIRGGSWLANERMCRPTFRARDHDTSRHNTDGFRVVLEIASGS